MPGQQSGGISNGSRPGALGEPGRFVEAEEAARQGRRHAHGPPPKTTEAQQQVIRARLVKGETVTAVARDFKVSRATVLTVRDNARP